jgi:hypothetical protein
MTDRRTLGILYALIFFVMGTYGALVAFIAGGSGPVIAFAALWIGLISMGAVVLWRGEIARRKRVREEEGKR